MVESSTLVALGLAEAPDHAVLHDSSKYDLRFLRFTWGYGEFAEPSLFVELTSHEERVTLLFSGVKALAIPSEELISGISVRIIDASRIHPQGLGKVRVQHPKGGGLSFWADKVTLLERKVIG